MDRGVKGNKFGGGVSGLTVMLTDRGRMRGQPPGSRVLHYWQLLLITALVTLQTAEGENIYHTNFLSGEMFKINLNANLVGNKVAKF